MTKTLDKSPRRPKRRPKTSGSLRGSRRAQTVWPPERRARQRKLIRRIKPWKKSTGPRTKAGKARSAANALKHGFRSRAFLKRIREERQLVREATRTIALAKALIRVIDNRAITVWTADPADEPRLILTSLGWGATGRTTEVSPAAP